MVYTLRPVIMCDRSAAYWWYKSIEGMWGELNNDKEGVLSRVWYEESTQTVRWVADSVVGWEEMWCVKKKAEEEEETAAEEVEERSMVVRGEWMRSLRDMLYSLWLQRRYMEKGGTLGAMYTISPEDVLVVNGRWAMVGTPKHVLKIEDESREVLFRHIPPGFSMWTASPELREMNVLPSRLGYEASVSYSVGILLLMRLCRYMKCPMTVLLCGGGGEGGGEGGEEDKKGRQRHHQQQTRMRTWSELNELPPLMYFRGTKWGAFFERALNVDAEKRCLLLV